MIIAVKLQTKQVKALIRKFSIQISLDFLGFMIACFMLRGLWFSLSVFFFFFLFVAISVEIFHLKFIFHAKNNTAGENINLKKFTECWWNRMAVGFIMVVKVLIRLSDCRFDFVSKKVWSWIGLIFPSRCMSGRWCWWWWAWKLWNISKQLQHKKQKHKMKK